MGIYRNPMADDGPNTDALRETIRGNLTGMDLSEAIAMDVALGNKLDALLLLVAAGANDQCDWGKQLQQIVETAAELAIDAKVRQ